MALPVQSIGALTFNVMRGTIHLPRDTNEVIARPGVDHVAVRDTGVRAPQSTVTTTRDVVDYDDGITVFATYTALINGALQAVVKDDHDYDATDSVQFAVLAVEQVELIAAENIVNPLSTNPTAILRARWVLQAVPSPP